MATENNIIVLDKQNDILAIVIESKGTAFTSGEKAKAGKTYRRYSFNGIGFMLDEDHPFNASFDAKKDLASVRLREKTYTKTIRKVGEDGTTTDEVSERKAYDLVAFITKGEMREARLFEAQMGAIDRMATAELTPDALQVLMNNPV